MNYKVELSYEELQILMQCIQSLNFEGKHVIKVGLLGHKLQTELSKIEEKAKKNEQQTK